MSQNYNNYKIELINKRPNIEERNWKYVQLEAN